jgi:hypothetical protein
VGACCLLLLLLLLATATAAAAALHRTVCCWPAMRCVDINSGGAKCATPSQSGLAGFVGLVRISRSACVSFHQLLVSPYSRPISPAQSLCHLPVNRSCHFDTTLTSPLLLSNYNSIKDIHSLFVAPTADTFPFPSSGENTGQTRNTLDSIPGPARRHPNAKRFQVGSRGHR